MDNVIITHPHRDHLDDILNFDALYPRTLLRPNHLSESDVRGGNYRSDRFIDKYLEIDGRYDQLVAPTADPCEPANNGGVEVKTFDSPSCPTSNLNNHSIVTVVSYAGSKMLIPGDNEAPSWRELLKQKDFRDSIRGTDILLASHHGREAGFADELFEHTCPLLTIISDGPSGDTSATDLYRQKTEGWFARKRNGGTEIRKCLTIRKDGVVVVEFSGNTAGQRFVNVTVD